MKKASTIFFYQMFRCWYRILTVRVSKENTAIFENLDTDTLLKNVIFCLFIKPTKDFFMILLPDCLEMIKKPKYFKFCTTIGNLFQQKKTIFCRKYI